MCKPKEYEVDKTKVGSSFFYFIGNRYMIVNNNFIDTGNKTITPIPMNKEEMEALIKILDTAIENKDKITL